jgi:hypothetical protein
MAWTCPDCGKEFRNVNQWHSCVSTSVETHLHGKSVSVRAIVEKLIGNFERLADVTINPVKTSIQVKAGATFLSLRAKKDHVEIEFQLGREVDDFPVFKSVRVSKNRVVHVAILEDMSDVDDKLLGWLRESCDLVRG